jgi:hypothetical protein
MAEEFVRLRGRDELACAGRLEIGRGIVLNGLSKISGEQIRKSLIRCRR